MASREPCFYSKGRKFNYKIPRLPIRASSYPVNSVEQLSTRRKLRERYSTCPRAISALQGLYSFLGAMSAPTLDSNQSANLTMCGTQVPGRRGASKRASKPGNRELKIPVLRTSQRPVSPCDWPRGRQRRRQAEFRRGAAGIRRQN